MEFLGEDIEKLLDLAVYGVNKDKKIFNECMEFFPEEIVSLILDYRKTLGSATPLQPGRKEDWLSWSSNMSLDNSGSLCYKGRRVILATVHGSGLYGLNHANSDDDRYIVLGDIGDYFEERIQRISGGDDVIAAPIDKYINYIKSGSHQALEALYSPYALWAPKYESMLRKSVPDKLSMRDKYYSAAKKFIMVGCENNVIKKTRHGFRLIFDYADFADGEILYPHKTNKQVNILNNLAEDIIRFYRK